MSTPEIVLPSRLAPLVTVLQTYQQDHQVKPLLEHVIDQLPALLEVERCSLFLLDPVNGRIMLQYGTGMLERELTLPLAGNLAGEVIQNGIPRIVEDLTPYQSVQQEVQEMTGFTTNTILCVPILYPKGKCCAGALQILNPLSNRRLGMEDIQELTELASHLRQPVEALIEQHKKFLQELERKKKKGRQGLVASVLSQWAKVSWGGR